MFLRRIGTFFFILGIALVALYLISDMAGSPDLLYAGLGVLIGTLGLILRNRYRPEPPPPAGRFRLLKGGAKGGAIGGVGKPSEKSAGGKGGEARGNDSSNRSQGGASGGKSTRGSR